MSYTKQDILSHSGHFNLYQRMIEEISDYAIILLDKEGYIRNWNKGAEAIKLYTDKEIVGRHFSIFYFPEDVAAQLPGRLINEAALFGKAYHEGWRRRKDGTRFWGSVTITALHEDGQEIIGFAKVTRDLTERKISEDNLRLSEERYHKMVSEVQDYAIILMDETGHIQNWNAGAEKIKGYSAREIIGRRFDVFYPETDKKNGLPDELLEIARKENRATHEGWRVRKDGTQFWGSIIITALHDDDNNVIGFSKVTRDLTDKKLAEERLMTYMRELEARNKELEQFAYVASHDLQEPLRKIRTFTGLIRENYGDEAFVLRYFDKLDRSATRMSDLIKSLLNYSRLAQDNEEKSPVDLNCILSEVKTDFELLIQERNAVIHCSGLPVVNGYYMQFLQLFSNLVSNSLKFSAESPRIEIHAARVLKNEVPVDDEQLFFEQFVRLTFRDNGIGFEQQYSETIFSLFQRLNEREEYAGTGIGLALCRKITQNHGGFIFSDSKPGKGATFTVFLPVERGV